MIFEKSGDDTYRISKFVYCQRPIQEGKEHLDQLLTLYPVLSEWEIRKTELRKCILKQY